MEVRLRVEELVSVQKPEKNVIKEHFRLSEDPEIKTLMAFKLQQIQKVLKIVLTTFIGCYDVKIVV